MQGVWVVALIGVVAVLTGGLCRGLVIVLPRLGVVDVSGARSSHSGTVPRGGGATFILWIGVFLAGRVVGGIGAVSALLLVALLGLALTGLVDDIFTLGAPIRLASQTICSIAVLSIVVDPGSASWIIILLIFGWLIGFVNAFNFMDGIDGISTVSGGLIGCHLLLLTNQVGSTNHAPLLAIVVGGLIGFGFFNMPRASLFLGDAGSYFIGGVLAACAVHIWRSGQPFTVVFAPFLIYVVDVGTTLVVRICRGESPFKAHREHTYQRCVAAGWSHVRTSLSIALLTFCLIAAVRLPSYQIEKAPVSHLAVGALIAFLYLSLPRMASR